MTKPHSLKQLLLCALLCTSTACTSPLASLAQSPAPQSTDAGVAARIAAQNALFEEQWQAGLRENPQRATSVGDYRYNDQLGDYTAAHLAAVNAENKSYLARLTAIATTGFPEQDLLSHELMVRGLRQRIENHELKDYEMPVNQENGIHTSLSDLPNAIPLDSVKHYEDYIARLHQIPRVLDETTETMRMGMRDRLMPPRYIAEKVAAQSTDVANSKPFLLPIKKIPASFSDADRQRITAAIQQAVDTEVSPAYIKFAAFVANDYAPHGRASISVESLPTESIATKLQSAR
jgi:uncharacterized protein (DUF885 family)